MTHDLKEKMTAGVNGSMVCVVAHPDDESRLCGGILALLATKSVDVHIVSLTRGEGGELGEPPLCTREELGAVREQEMRCACEALGARSVTFLDYVDPLVGPENALFAPEADEATLAGQIAQIVRGAGAQAVLAHGTNGEYGHPGHRLAHRGARAAVELLKGTGAGSAPVFYTFGASFPENPRPRLGNADDPAHIVVDIRPYLDRVLAATLCHTTQHALFVRRRSKEQGRPASIEEVVYLETHEAVRRQWPPVADGDAPEDVFAGWLSA